MKGQSSSCSTKQKSSLRKIMEKGTCVPRRTGTNLENAKNILEIEDGEEKIFWK